MNSSGPLRIAVVHSFYSSRQPSGENIVVDLQVDALRRAGHEVEVVARSTDELERSTLYPLRAGWRAATGLGDSPLDEVRAFDPDIVHVHNLFPNLGRRWVNHTDVPLVATLHNYRPICPAATLFRDGDACTLCPDSGSAHHAIRYSCFKDSRAQTVPVALGTRFADDPLLARADRIVTLNSSMRATYASYGVSAEKLVTIPNFVRPAASNPADPGDHWLFVGRLTRVKGILELLRQWPADRRLLVAGAGPDEAEARALGGPNVTFLGQRTQAEVQELLTTARGLLFPSLWPEGLPTIYLEALAAGLPVIAWPQSIVGSLVVDEGTGFVTSGDVAADLTRADGVFPTLRDHCRGVFAAHYSESAWLTAIGDVYAAAMGRA